MARTCRTAQSTCERRHRRQRTGALGVTATAHRWTRTRNAYSNTPTAQPHGACIHAVKASAVRKSEDANIPHVAHVAQQASVAGFARRPGAIHTLQASDAKRAVVVHKARRLHAGPEALQGHNVLLLHHPVTRTLHRRQHRREGVPADYTVQSGGGRRTQTHSPQRPNLNPPGARGAPATSQSRHALQW
jgi:hypothetical protein